MINLRHTFSQDLSSGALNITKEFVYDTELIQVMMKFNTPVTEQITITFVSRDGSSYDTPIDTELMIANDHYILSRVTQPIVIQQGDKIKIQCTNANGIGTVYGTILMGVSNGRQ